MLVLNDLVVWEVVQVYDRVAYLASVSITSLAGHFSLHDAVLPVFLDVANAIAQGWQTGP